MTGRFFRSIRFTPPPTSPPGRISCAAFNEFAYQRRGIPLLNQSPFVERRHVEAAYGGRWSEFIRMGGRGGHAGRMLNPFFAGLLS